MEIKCGNAACQAHSAASASRLAQTLLNVEKKKCLWHYLMIPEPLYEHGAAALLFYTRAGVWDSTVRDRPSMSFHVSAPKLWDAPFLGIYSVALALEHSNMFA